MREKIKKLDLKWKIIIGLALFFVLMFIKVQFSKNHEQITEIWVTDLGGPYGYAALICQENIQVPEGLKLIRVGLNLSDNKNEEKNEKLKYLNEYEPEKGYRVLTEYIHELYIDDSIYTGFLEDNNFQVLVCSSVGIDSAEVFLTYPISYYQERGCYSNIFYENTFIMDLSEYGGYKGVDYENFVDWRIIMFKEYPDRDGYVQSMGVFYFIIAFVVLVIRAVISSWLQVLPVFWYAKRRGIVKPKERKRYIFTSCMVFQIPMSFLLSECLWIAGRFFGLFIPIVFIIAIISEISAFNYNLYCERFKGWRMLVMSVYVIVSNIIMLIVGYYLAYLSMPFGYLI